jgi:hypothetical protein
MAWRTEKFAKNKITSPLMSLSIFDFETKTCFESGKNALFDFFFMERKFSLLKMFSPRRTSLKGPVKLRLFLSLSYSSKINGYLYYQRVSPPLKKMP